MYAKEAVPVRLAEKLGSLISRDKFGAGFKNALKRQNFFISAKESDSVF